MSNTDAESSQHNLEAGLGKEVDYTEQRRNCYRELGAMSPDLLARDPDQLDHAVEVFKSYLAARAFTEIDNPCSNLSADDAIRHMKDPILGIQRLFIIEQRLYDEWKRNLNDDILKAAPTRKAELQEEMLQMPNRLRNYGLIAQRLIAERDEIQEAKEFVYDMRIES